MRVGLLSSQRRGAHIAYSKYLAQGRIERVLPNIRPVKLTYSVAQTSLLALVGTLKFYLFLLMLSLLPLSTSGFCAFHRLGLASSPSSLKQMASSQATRRSNSAKTNECYVHFTRLVEAVAERHQAYLQAEGLVITDCYHLHFTDAKARFQVTPGLPQPLHEALRQCYLESFG
jgi:hypothetical protein